MNNNSGKAFVIIVCALIVACTIGLCCFAFGAFDSEEHDLQNADSIFTNELNTEGARFAPPDSCTPAQDICVPANDNELTDFDNDTKDSYVETREQYNNCSYSNHAYNHATVQTDCR